MRDSRLMKVAIETLLCLECGSPTRVKHDDMLLKVEGRCGSCGKEVVFTTDRPLHILKRPIRKGPRVT